MGDLLNAGSRWLSDVLHEYASRQVTYVRGPDSVTLTAVIGQQEFLIGTGPGRSKLIRSDRDFFIKAAELKLGGELVTPEKGDKVLDFDGTYELASFNDEPWFQADQDGIELQCHTRRVARP
jgi:hypothetical protein